MLSFFYTICFWYYIFVSEIICFWYYLFLKLYVFDTICSSFWYYHVSDIIWHEHLPWRTWDTIDPYRLGIRPYQPVCCKPVYPWLANQIKWILAWFFVLTKQKHIIDQFSDCSIKRRDRLKLISKERLFWQWEKYKKATL